jgi:hypothetical protein
MLQIVKILYLFQWEEIYVCMRKYVEASSINNYQTTTIFQA